MLLNITSLRLVAGVGLPGTWHKCGHGKKECKGEGEECWAMSHFFMEGCLMVLVGEQGVYMGT